MLEIGEGEPREDCWSACVPCKEGDVATDTGFPGKRLNWGCFRWQGRGRVGIINVVPVPIVNFGGSYTMQVVHNESENCERFVAGAMVASSGTFVNMDWETSRELHHLLYTGVPCQTDCRRELRMLKRDVPPESTNMPNGESGIRRRGYFIVAITSSLLLNMTDVPIHNLGYQFSRQPIDREPELLCTW